VEKEEKELVEGGGVGRLPLANFFERSSCQRTRCTNSEQENSDGKDGEIASPQFKL